MGDYIKVLIVDDHDFFRKGLTILLRNLKNVEIVGIAQNGQEFLDTVGQLNPDVVLMDISMPKVDGIAATREAVRKYSGLRIIGLTGHEDRQHAQEMKDAGVVGFLNKEVGLDELFEAIEIVNRGEPYFPEEMAG